VNVNAFGIEGLSPSPTGTPNVENWVNSQNPGSAGGGPTSGAVGGTLLISATDGFTAVNVPLMAAQGGIDPTNASANAAPSETTTPPSSDTQPDTSAQTVYVDPAVLVTAFSLGTIVEQAIENWEATGLTAAQDAYLRTVTVSFADLGGVTLGQATPGQITLDDNAAGFGWYIDPSPQDNAEFSNAASATELLTDPSLAPAGHIDLLTTIEHELGHELGLNDTYDPANRDSLMYGYIVAGERRLPAVGEADGATPGNIVGQDFALSPVSIGVLPAGKAVAISWQATVNNQNDQLIVNPQNQGTVSGSNLVSNVLTNVVTTTLDSLTLGGTVYNDKNFNSQFDAGDTGISGVALTLFDDSNHDNVFDAGDTQIATTTTSAGGTYSFTGLAPGDYIVRVDSSNFTAGGALATFKNASPVVAADPDDNGANDNDAQPLSGGIVVTKAITLAYNSEPTAGTGNDTNNTLDLGFVQNQHPHYPARLPRYHSRKTEQPSRSRRARRCRIRTTSNSQRLRSRLLEEPSPATATYLLRPRPAQSP
jgi:hypothetical protein